MARLLLVGACAMEYVDSPETTRPHKRVAVMVSVSPTRLRPEVCEGWVDLSQPGVFLFIVFILISHRVDCSVH